MATLPVIPENITVHLGAPSSDAPNVTVSFPDYIKNVASSEIYPTWPENALRANIYAQISFALNRIYTEYYRSRGYDFDITNSTAIDQSFVYGRDIFDNISEIVDDIFNDYIVRGGFVEPLFALYCDGTTVTCDGLSQWGSVDLAEQGYIPYDILRYYYGDDINIVMDAPVENIDQSYPSVPLSLGSAGNDVRTVQTRLNRISANYPAIPKISNPNGIFSSETDAAVRKFQEIFSLTADGIVGKATWYRIQSIYNAVKKL
ncbi:MAG: peptidoglycan-binding protein, partial [Clostridia bacterium]|nr:peptidoglycan-binding protein [Clostridia bacterium]